MGVFENNVGACLLGIFLNTYLYGIVTFQYLSYFGTRFKDPLWIKATVILLFLLDTFHSSSLIYLAWYYVIANYGNPIALLVPLWPYPFTVFSITFTALLTHFCLSFRLLRFSNIYIFSLMLTLSFASFAMGLACGVLTYSQVKRPSDMSTINPLMSAWLSLQVITDILISGLLILALRGVRTGFDKSDTVINRLVRTAVQTGSFSGIFSIVGLAFYVARPDTQYFALLGLSIGRVYTNTLMDTLLCREALRGLLNQTVESEPYEDHSRGVNVHKEVSLGKATISLRGRHISRHLSMSPTPTNDDELRFATPEEILN